MAHPPPQNKDKSSLPYRIWRVFSRSVLILSLLLVLFSFVGAGSLLGYLAVVAKKEPIRTRQETAQQFDNLSQTSHAFFADGSKIGALRSDADRSTIPIQQVSPLFIQALLATEDREFYDHLGISLRGILRAARDNVFQGKMASGGSTITQQLVKNMVLQNREKALQRKLREMVISLRMERMFTKNEILTFYLNSLYFGQGEHHRNLLGIQAASKEIFGVNADHLTLPQAAYLAGMIQRPSAYNPYHSDTLAAGERRMKKVLRSMVSTGVIQPSVYDQAVATNIAPTLNHPPIESTFRRHPFLMTAVEEEAAKILMKQDGLDAKSLSKQGRYRSTMEQYRKRVLTGGLRIETTIDQKLDAAMNQAATNSRLYAHPIQYTALISGKKRTIKNALEEVGSVVLNTKDNSILAFVGGRDFTNGQTNHALSARRQPGSTIKPLLDYAPALEAGLITPGTPLMDEPLTTMNGDGSEKTYKNYNNQYQGPVTARQALTWSLNIPALQLFRQLGKEEAFTPLKKMNFPIKPQDGEASAIGGFTRGFTVAEMTGGYAALAHDGIWEPPHLIRQIMDPSGNILYRYTSSPQRIYSHEASFLTIDMLRDVMRKGTGRWVGYRSPGYDLAGKTGTTQNGHDLWFIGTTPQVALGVWVGYDINHPLTDDRRAKRVWSHLFQAMTKARPDLITKTATFPPPDTLEQVETCTLSGLQATEACRMAHETKKDWVRKEEAPTVECPLHMHANVVQIGNQDYIANPHTPTDLVQERWGAHFAPESSAARWYKGNQVPTKMDPRLGGETPFPPHVHLSPLASGNIHLQWREGGGNVAGWRIYEKGNLVASIPSGNSLSWTGPPGEYTMTAVDVAGMESDPATAIPRKKSTGQDRS
ncbi:transglycosylase domain-containing protein [Marininema halotolerans]|uniref:Penicillin-binding protein n=1 Tax=Marininema halotolerans TaxID=1155944 RepID=A0A1I6PV25_9BACL|nr:transglycosylase domain-containing protein [Marininema halotolerans]SFS43928.1 penicillin-binding protein [Marininema halotolerans]